MKRTEKMRGLFTVILFLIVQATAVLAQTGTITISGKVISASNNETLPGATVAVAGKSLGTITDGNGNFKISVADSNDILKISYVGYLPQEIRVGSKTEINVILSEDLLKLDEVVVVGYGVTRKRDIAGAVSSIKTDDIKAGVVTNTAQLIKGRAAGVQVKQSTLEPGGGISVRIRGASSVSSNNNPLYVIDGFQTELGNLINPDDVASIEILKDAAATAIYGARGANGVVIITTKKGSKDVFSVDYSYNFSHKKLNNPWELMDAQDFINYNMSIWEGNGSAGNPPYTEEQLQYKGSGTDWVKELTRDAATQSHQFTIIGGQDKLTMSISGNNIKDVGILQNTEFNRTSGRVNLEYKLNDRVRFGSNFYLAKSNKNYLTMGTNTSLDNSIYQIFMTSPLVKPTGENVFGEAGKRPGVYSEVLDKDFNVTTINCYETVFGEVDILKSLMAKVQYTYSNSSGKSQKYYSKSTILGSSYDGQATVEDESEDHQQVDAILTWHQNIGKKHDLKLIAGSTYITNTYEYSDVQAHGFTTDEFKYYNLNGAKVVDYINSSRSDRRSISYFSRAEYVLNEKYIFNASIRADGSSNFGPGNKWGYFPSASLAWQLGNEPFMSFINPVFNSLKLRASYGQTGNDGIGSYLSQMKFTIGDVYLGGEQIQKGMWTSNPGNAKLKWETTSQLNFGADMAMFKGRIEVNFDWYYKTTSDLLTRVNVSSSTGGFTTQTGNNGKIENEGIELFIKSNNISKKDFSWSTTLNISKNKNKVLELNNGEPTFYTTRPHGSYNYQEYIMLKEGNSLSSLYGYVFDGIIQTGETYTPQPLSVAGDPKFKDISGPNGTPDGIIDENDRKVIGDGNPDIVFGFGNNFRLWDFDFSFFFDASIGNDLLNLNRILLEDNNRLKVSAERWTKNNPSNTVPAKGWQKNAGIKYGSFVNTRFVEDASFIRLSNIELGYTLNKVKYMKSLRVYIGAQRLLTFTNYTGFDPEVSTISNKNGTETIKQGLDFASYPDYKMYNFGAKITF